jgi:hypothetical protein
MLSQLPCESKCFKKAQKSYKTLNNKPLRNDWAWLYMPAIQVTWEVEIGGSQFEVGSGKSARPYLKNKLKAKRLGPAWLKQ